MTGGNIKSAVFRAASRAALRGEGEQRVLWKSQSSSTERRRYDSFQNSFDRRGKCRVVLAWQCVALIISCVSHTHMYALIGEREVALKDLEEAAEEEIGKTSTRIGFRRQDSDAARMYNQTFRTSSCLAFNLLFDIDLFSLQSFIFSQCSHIYENHFLNNNFDQLDV